MQTTNCVDVRPIPGFSISQLPNLNPGCILCRLWRYAKHLRRGVQKWQAHWRTIVQSLAGRRVIKEAENRPKMRSQDCKFPIFSWSMSPNSPAPTQLLLENALVYRFKTSSSTWRTILKSSAQLYLRRAVYTECFFLSGSTLFSSIIIDLLTCTELDNFDSNFGLSIVKTEFIC